MKRSSKVIVNTGILYVKMIITIVISLLSTRWVLMALGEEDYGIYSLVGGVIAMFSFLNTALSSATQRFLSFEIGRGNSKSIKEVFYNSIILHLGCGIILALIFLLGGQYLIDYVLTVPQEKVEQAKFVLMSMSISTFFVVISAPYQATMNAHENMLIISIIDIVYAIGKLLLAIYLLYYIGDSLKLYSIGIMLLSLMSLFISCIYCIIKYKETHFKWHIIKNFNYIKNIGSYLGWLLFGFVCSLGRVQAVPILLNILFGVVVNAAYGIANQINSQLSFFSNSLLRAIRPQIIQSEGECNTNRMIFLSFTACKFAFFGLSCFVIPLILNINYILGLWLDTVPYYTATFTIIILIISLVNQINAGAFIANESKGNIRSFQIVTGCLDLMALPIGYIMSAVTKKPYWMLLVSLILVVLTHFVAIKITCKLLSLEISMFFKSVTLPILIFFIPSFIITYCVKGLIIESFFSIVVCMLLYITFAGFIFFQYGMNQMERSIIVGLLQKLKIAEDKKPK